MTATPNTRKVRGYGVSLTVGTSEQLGLDVANGPWAVRIEDTQEVVFVTTRKAAFDTTPEAFGRKVVEADATPAPAKPKAAKAAKADVAPEDDFDAATAPVTDATVKAAKLTPAQKSFLNQASFGVLFVANTDTGGKRTLKALEAKGLVTKTIVEDGYNVAAVNGINS